MVGLYIPNKGQVLDMQTYLLSLQYALHLPIKEIIHSMYGDGSANGGIINRDALINKVNSDIIFQNQSIAISNKYNLITIEKTFTFTLPTAGAGEHIYLVLDSLLGVGNPTFTAKIENDVTLIAETNPTSYQEYIDIGYIDDRGNFVLNILTSSLSVLGLPQPLLDELNSDIAIEDNEEARYQVLLNAGFQGVYAYGREGIYMGFEGLAYSFTQDKLTLKATGAPVGFLNYVDGFNARAYKLMSGESLTASSDALLSLGVNHYMPVYIDANNQLQIKDARELHIGERDLINYTDLTYPDIGIAYFRPNNDYAKDNIYIGAILKVSPSENVYKYIFIPQIADFSEYNILNILVPTYEMYRDRADDDKIKYLLPLFPEDGYRLPIPSDAHIHSVKYIIDIKEPNPMNNGDKCSADGAQNVPMRRFYQNMYNSDINIYALARDRIQTYEAPPSEGAIEGMGPNVAPFLLYKNSNKTAYYINTAIMLPVEDNSFIYPQFTTDRTEGNRTYIHAAGISNAEKFHMSGTGFSDPDNYTSIDAYGFMTIVITYGYTNNGVLSDRWMMDYSGGSMGEE